MSFPSLTKTCIPGASGSDFCGFVNADALCIVRFVALIMTVRKSPPLIKAVSILWAKGLKIMLVFEITHKGT